MGKKYFSTPNIKYSNIQKKGTFFSKILNFSKNFFLSTGDPETFSKRNESNVGICHIKKFQINKHKLRESRYALNKK